MTGKQLHDWIHEDNVPANIFERAVSWKTKNNPEATRAFLDKNYPGLLPNWARNGESTDANVKEMANHVISRGEASGNRDAFFQVFNASVPYLKDQQNWTNIIDL